MRRSSIKNEQRSHVRIRDSLPVFSHIEMNASVADNRYEKINASTDTGMGGKNFALW